MIEINEQDSKDETPLDAVIAHRIDLTSAIRRLPQREQDALMTKLPLDLSFPRFDSMSACAHFYRVSPAQVYTDAKHALHQLRRILGKEYLQCR